MATTAEYQRDYRARRGARTGQPGRAPVEPHGTPAGYTRHRRAEEEPCQPCRDAWNADVRARRARRRAEAEALAAEQARKRAEANRRRREARARKA